MDNYILSCCSTADLTAAQLKERNISYICYHYYINGKMYEDDLGKSMSPAEFYNVMREGADAKTTQVNVEEFVEYFTPMLEAGKDVIHITLSSGITGSYNSARIAQGILSEKYPDRKLYIVDSLGASSGYGLLMDKAADLRDQGYSIDELRDWVLENRLKLHHWFFSSDLTYFIKGGRISKAAGIFGTVLKICPVMNVSVNGKLIPRIKARGKRRAIAETVAKMVQYAEGGKEYNQKVYLCHSDCKEDADQVAGLIKDEFKKMYGEPKIMDIGATIGSHTGPGTVAIFFWGEERKD